MRIAFVLAALVAVPAATTEVVRLSPAERDAVLSAAARGPERAAVLTPERFVRPSLIDRSLYPEAPGRAAAPGRKVHGEVSVFAGTGGLFGMSGTAVMPIGDSGMAAISVLQGSSRWGGVQGLNFGYASGNARNNVSAGGSFVGLGGSPLGFGASPLGFGDGALGFGDSWNGPYNGRRIGPPRRR